MTLWNLPQKCKDELTFKNQKNVLQYKKIKDKKMNVSKDVVKVADKKN